MTIPVDGLSGDVEQLLTGWLASALGVRVVTKLPDQIDVEIVKVAELPGTEITPAHDRCQVDVDVFVPPDEDGNEDTARAKYLGAQIRAALLRHLPGQSAATQTGTVTVTAVSTTSTPVRRAYDDDSPVVRVHATYGLIIATRDT